MKAGETVVEFDPYDAREGGRGRAGRPDGGAGEDRQGAGRGHEERGLARPRPRRGEGAARRRRDLQADGREPLLAPPDHRVAARPRPLRRRAPTWRRASSTRAASCPRPSGRSARSTRARRGSRSTIAEKGLRSLRIQAPHDGLLVLERNWRGEMPSVGDTLWPGQKIAELPDLSKLEAKVFVLEADGAGLKAGQKARFAIEGRPGEEYEATVSRVEPLAKTRDCAVAGEVLRDDALAREDRTRAFMKPGQKVRAVVRLEEADGVLAIPRGAVFEKDGKRVVYRRERRRLRPGRDRRSARQSISRVVLDSGLAAGDVIALRDPTEKRALGPTGGRPRRGRASDRPARGARLGPREPAPPRAALVPGDARDHLRRGRGHRDALDRGGSRAPGARDHRRDGPAERRGEGQALRPRERAHRDPPEVGRALDPRRAAIREAVPGVERVVAKIEVEAWKVLSPAGRAKPRVLGVSSDYPALVKLALVEGRFFDRDGRGHATPRCA